MTPAFCNSEAMRRDDHPGCSRTDCVLAGRTGTSSAHASHAPNATTRIAKNFSAFRMRSSVNAALRNEPLARGGGPASIHERLQDEHRGHSIHHLRTAPNAHVSFAQQAIRLRGAEPLVP